jgi:hypothetical protein
VRKQGKEERKGSLFFFFFFFWALVASAPRSTAACRLIVRARLWKFLLIPPGAPPRIRRKRPLAGKGKSKGREMSGEFCCQIASSTLFEGIFYMPQICNMGLYFPSEGRHAEDFFALKNLMASAGF